MIARVIRPQQRSIKDSISLLQPVNNPNSSPGCAVESRYVLSLNVGVTSQVARR